MPKLEEIPGVRMGWDDEPEETTPTKRNSPILPVKQGKFGSIVHKVGNYAGAFGTGANKSIANTAGLPVDLINKGLGLVGFDSKEPVMGSQWIQNHLMPKPTPMHQYSPDSITSYPKSGWGGNFAETLGEYTPNALLGEAPALLGVAKTGANILPTAIKAIPATVGASTGATIAREKYPNNPFAEVAGSMLGGGVGGGLQAAKQSLYRGKWGIPSAGIDKYIASNLNKAIRPSVSGKKVMSDVAKYEGRGVNAVKNIVYDSRERGLPVPSNLQEFGERVQSLRDKIYKQYHSMTTKTGQQGLRVNLRGLGDELREVVGSAPDMHWDADVVKFAQDKLDDIRRIGGSYSPEEAERAIQILNHNLEGYYAGRGSGISETKAKLMEGIATKLRKALDETIEQFEGPGYQKLKNQYGELKAIEKDIVRRSIVDRRQQPFGFFDLSDMFSTSKLVYGMAHADPASAAAGGAMLAAKRWAKSQNNPNNMVKWMFEKLDRYLPEKEQWPNMDEHLNGPSFRVEPEVIPPEKGLVPVPPQPARPAEAVRIHPQGRQNINVPPGGFGLREPDEIINNRAMVPKFPNSRAIDTEATRVLPQGRTNIAVPPGGYGMNSVEEVIMKIKQQNPGLTDDMIDKYLADALRKLKKRRK